MLFRKMKRNNPNYIKNNLYMIGKIFRISPFFVIHAFLVQLLMQAERVFFTVVFMRYLFGADEITRTFDNIAIFLSVTALVMAVKSAYLAWYVNIFQKRAEQKVNFALSREIFGKAAAVDLSCFENPDFFDTYTKAATEATARVQSFPMTSQFRQNNTEGPTRAQSVLNECAALICVTLGTSFVIYTIMDINLFAGVFSFVSFVGSFFFGRIGNRLRYERDMDRVPYNRRISYVNRVMYLAQYAKEMRLTSIFSVIIGIYNEALTGVIKVIDKYWKKLYAFDLSGQAICFTACFQGMWLYGAYLAMVRDTILIGDFIVLSSAIVSTTWMLFGVRDAIIGSIQNAMFIQNLRNFLSYTPKINENQSGLPIESVKEIELRNVSFRYTENGSDILKNINMTVKAGERVALVGHNGAGKTTLVKLIMRLYDPTEGQIFLNGIDIREYDLKEYRTKIGVAFQDYQIFSMSAAENVLMKRLEDENDRTRAIHAMEESGVYEKISTLENREDTVLTREFDDHGAVLSGGENQKIATARAFAEDARILVLDEPSSALDPVAEYMMYETIMRLCSSEDDEGKIAFIISHRLSSAISSDRIYMLENGEVVDYGTHKELLSRGGAYANMYGMQAKNYLFEEDAAI